MTDRHRIWRIVERNYRAMEEHAPDGYAARVDVYLHGSPDPLPLSRVTSRKDDPWLLFEVYASLSDEVDPGDRLTFATESSVARIEVVYVRKSEGSPIGFRVEEAAAETEV